MLLAGIELQAVERLWRLFTKTEESSGGYASSTFQSHTPLHKD
jgi:hypothetical protein